MDNYPRTFQLFLAPASLPLRKSMKPSRNACRDAGHFLSLAKRMLEIRTAPSSFVVFDTLEDEPVMRFDTRDEALNLIVELTMAETRAQLQAWASPKQRASQLR